MRLECVGQYSKQSERFNCPVYTRDWLAGTHTSINYFISRIIISSKILSTKVQLGYVYVENVG